MVKRILTTIVSIALLMPVLLLSHTALLPFALATLTLFALFEIFRCMGAKTVLTIPLCRGRLLPFVEYLQRPQKSASETALLLAILVLLYLLTPGFDKTTNLRPGPACFLPFISALKPRSIWDLESHIYLLF